MPDHFREFCEMLKRFVHKEQDTQNAQICEMWEKPLCQPSGCSGTAEAGCSG